MAASYPSSAKTFTTKSNNTTADASHINDLQLEVTALEQDLIAGLPATRGGTGLTALPASGFAPVSNGSAYVATDVRADNDQYVISAQVFS
jgi:hypothetical protein